ncbi:unnamed protein product [Brassica napus]|uniref:(rape) hypothetical protein n=1 Tax=Brassica napus TaxID=3708 RepID=A0A816WYU3_BRANA|nr:unnamed protein product [Brassica napus]
MRLSLTHGRKELSYDSNNSCSTRFSYSATSISDYTSTRSYTNRLTTTAPKVAPVISPAASLHNHHKACLCQLQPHYHAPPPAPTPPSPPSRPVLTDSQETSPAPSPFQNVNGGNALNQLEGRVAMWLSTVLGTLLLLAITA